MGDLRSEFWKEERGWEWEDVSGRIPDRTPGGPGARDSMHAG